MSKLPLDFSRISNGFKNTNLSKPMIVVKYVGQLSLLVFALSFVIIQANGNEVGGTPLLDIASATGGYTFLLGIICLVIVAASVLGVKNTISKVFLYMFLPAIILTAILVVVFVLPNQ
jgi:hypothetical protein